MLRAGVIEIDITPPIGIELAGYGPNLDRFSEDIHDPLLAQVLALDDGQQRILLACLDVIGISEAFFGTAKNRNEGRDNNDHQDRSAWVV